MYIHNNFSFLVGADHGIGGGKAEWSVGMSKFARFWAVPTKKKKKPPKINIITSSPPLPPPPIYHLFYLLHIYIYPIK